MSDVVVRIEDLSKAYRIGLKMDAPDTLVRAVTSWFTAPIRNFRQLVRLNTFGTNGNAKNEQDIVWALKDVSFDVRRGEVVGIIGRNGAGKSTLLKILSRITQPTFGRALVLGRVASLLEVGTGFHPELTGRENLYMNGTILGMRKREIDRKFDEIVDFSGVEKFLDTPIKRYSSGMKVRLAFAVAAHLQPEILVIDEVLAVGDAEFQRKCLDKMQHVASGGRTVLFVSHNLRAVTELCSRAIRLVSGQVADSGEVKRVVTSYENSLTALGSTPEQSMNNAAKFYESEWFQVFDIAVSGDTAPDAHSYLSTAPIDIHIRCRTYVPIDELMLSFALLNEDRQSCIWERMEGISLPSVANGDTYSLNLRIPPVSLRTGIYCINFMVRRTKSLEKLYHLKEVAHFSLHNPRESSWSKGTFTPATEWTFSR